MIFRLTDMLKVATFNISPKLLYSSLHLSANLALTAGLFTPWQYCFMEKYI